MRSVTRGSTSVTCTICSQVSEANKLNQEELREEFPLNIYSVGQVALKRSGKHKPKDQLIGFYSQKKQMNSETVLCGECGERAADCSCLQCDVHFCTRCFTRIHDSSVILRKHEKVDIKGNYKLNKDAFCKEHKDRCLQIYCNDCELYCCKDCVFSAHLGHSCVEVEQKNVEVLEKFSEAYDEANAVLKQLYHTRKFDKIIVISDIPRTAIVKATLVQCDST
ncbi:hypothetical protein J6590_074239 [Homalodisca vitripennis]|nr:hypothetical protein J6590_074239 [Homalodisca vitripennis]